MQCPFLKEGRARYCHAAPVRKLILDGPGVAGGGLCASPDYHSCELAQDEEERYPVCPHLEEIQVQYCGASPVTRLVPFSLSQLSRCTSAGYRYCDSYLAVARPNLATPPRPDVLYAPNHLWLQPDDSNACHIGIDSFLEYVAGSVDGITFITSHGTHRPAAVLAIHGVEWPLVFPTPVLIEKVNCRLRGDPSLLTSDPYGAGWLFQGWELPGTTRAGLIGGGQAAAWQAEQRERASRPEVLSREELVRLFQRFFSKTDWTVEE